MWLFKVAQTIKSLRYSIGLNESKPLYSTDSRAGKLISLNKK